MENKIILVTGASSGFGRLISERLLESGHIVYACARRFDLMEKLRDKGAFVVDLDVTDYESVNSCVSRIIDEQGKIDIVFNNAGYGGYGNIENMSIENVKYQFDVNLFGAARINNAVLPYMRRQRSGRIIFTSSIVSHISMAGLGWYAASKHALRAMVEALRMEVSGLGIDIIEIEPGSVKTGFDEVAFKELDKIKSDDDYKNIITGFRAYVSEGYSRCPGPESTVKAMLAAAFAKKPKMVYKTTIDAAVLPRLKCILGKKMFSDTIGNLILKYSKK